MPFQSSEAVKVMKFDTDKHGNDIYELDQFASSTAVPVDPLTVFGDTESKYPDAVLDKADEPEEETVVPQFVADPDPGKKFKSKEEIEQDQARAVVEMAYGDAGLPLKEKIKWALGDVELKSTVEAAAFTGLTRGYYPAVQAVKAIFEAPQGDWKMTKEPYVDNKGVYHKGEYKKQHDLPLTERIMRNIFHPEEEVSLTERLPGYEKYPDWVKLVVGIAEDLSLYVGLGITKGVTKSVMKQQLFKKAVGRRWVAAREAFIDSRVGALDTSGKGYTYKWYETQREMLGRQFDRRIRPAMERGLREKAMQKVPRTGEGPPGTKQVTENIPSYAQAGKTPYQQQYENTSFMELLLDDLVNLGRKGQFKIGQIVSYESPSKGMMVGRIAQIAGQRVTINMSGRMVVTLMENLAYPKVVEITPEYKKLRADVEKKLIETEFKEDEYVPTAQQVTEMVETTFEGIEPGKDVGFILGPSASGKSTVAKGIYKEYQTPILDPDFFKPLFFETYTSEQAPFVHEASSTAAKIAVEKAMNEKLPFLNVVTGRDAAKFQRYVDRLLKGGSDIDAGYIYVELAESLRRAEVRRVSKGGIRIREEEIKAIHEGGLKTIFEVFIPHGDDVHLLANPRTTTGKLKIKPIATFKRGKLVQVRNKGLLVKMLKEWYTVSGKELSDGGAKEIIGLLQKNAKHDPRRSRGILDGTIKRGTKDVVSVKGKGAVAKPRREVIKDFAIDDVKVGDVIRMERRNDGYVIEEEVTKITDKMIFSKIASRAKTSYAKWQKNKNYIVTLERPATESPIDYLLEPSRVKAGKPVTQREIDNVVEYARSLGVNLDVKRVNEDAVFAPDHPDYLLFLTTKFKALGKAKFSQEVANALQKGKTYRVRGLHSVSTRGDGSLYSEILIYNGHNSETLGHEVIHAIDAQGGLVGYTGTKEERARYLSKFIAEGKTDSIVELTPQGSKVRKVSDIAGPVTKPIKLLTYNGTLNVGTGAEIIKPDIKITDVRINRPVRSGATPAKVFNFREVVSKEGWLGWELKGKTWVSTDPKWKGLSEMSIQAEKMARAMRSGKASLIRGADKNLYIVSPEAGVPAYKLTTPLKESNIKVKAYILDLPAVYTCKNCATCAPTCYAVGAQVQYPASKLGRFANLYMFMNHRGLLKQLINKQLAKNKFDLVRIHSSGDIFSQKYANFLEEMVNTHPEKQFYTYTKIGDINLSKLKSLSNFNMVNSLMPDGTNNYGSLAYIKAKAKEFKTKICPASLATGKLQAFKAGLRGDKEAIKKITAEFKDPANTIHCANPSYSGKGGKCNLCTKEKHMLFLEHGTPQRTGAQAMVNDIRDTHFIDNIQYDVEDVTPAALPEPAKPKDPYVQNREIQDKFEPKGDLKKTAREILDTGFIPISTRLSQIHETLRDAVRKHIYNTNRISQYDMSTVKPFLKGVRGMPVSDAKDLDFALKNRDVAKINELVKKHNLEKEYEKTQGIIQGIYNRAQAVGMEIGYLEDYFPRKVIDSEEYLKFLRKTTHWSQIEQAIKSEAKVIGRPLKDDEKVELINTMLRGYGSEKIPLTKPSPTKHRKLIKITPEMNRYYKDSGIALTDYIRGMNTSIEARRLFGKSKNLEDSIGGYVTKLIEDKIIDSADETNLRNIMKAYINQRGTRGIVSVAKNWTYVSTMGSPISAITQIGDLAFSLFQNGYYGTLKGAFKSVGRLSKQDLGLDIIAEEFTDTSKSSKIVNGVFKAIGLEAIDNFGKEALINSSFDRLTAEALRKDPELIATLERVFKGRAGQVLKDLAAKNPTEEVKYMLFAELADFQPIALSEMPEYYLRSGNFRVLYMLKTYTMKQIDVYHNKVFRMFDTNPKKAIKNLFKLVAAFALTGATADMIKDFLLGRKTTLTDLVLDNMLKTIGFSKWQIYKSRQEGIFTAFLQSIIPPVPFLDDIYKDAMKMTNKDKKGKVKDWRIWQRIPLVGKFYYWWFGGGREMIENRTKKKKLRSLS